VRMAKRKRGIMRKKQVPDDIIVQLNHSVE
jgi:hypothetical protein